MTALSFPYRTLPEPAQKVEVADGVFWLRFSLPFALDHINLWLLREGDGWVIVDTGFGDDATRASWRQTFEQALEGRPLTRIIVTHYHPDHIGQAAWLADTWDAPVWMTAGELALARHLYAVPDERLHGEGQAFFECHGLDRERAQAMVATGNRYRRAIPALPQPAEILRDGQVLTIDGRRWRIICGNGHSPEHACLYREEDGILISGDQVLPTISSNVSVHLDSAQDDPLSGFIESQHKIGQLPADTLVLPAHGRPFRGLRERTAALVGHHERQLARVDEACKEQPQSAADLLPVLFRPNLTPHELHFAMGESLAHLNYLERRGRLTRLEAEVVRFTV